jgi:hypothetical protein
MAFSKPLQKVHSTDEGNNTMNLNDITQIKDPWYHIENLRIQDRFKI